MLHAPAFTARLVYLGRSHDPLHRASNTTFLRALALYLRKPVATGLAELGEELAQPRVQPNSDHRHAGPRSSSDPNSAV